MLKGEFILRGPGLDGEIILPNMIVTEGGEALLKMALRGDNTIVPANDDFFVGMCNQDPVLSNGLTEITASEPTVTNGYARQAIERSSVGWPTVDNAGGVPRARSLDLAFTASGGNFSAAFSRLFLCTVASGTSGLLIAVSGRLATPVTVLNGATYDAAYRLFLGT